MKRVAYVVIILAVCASAVRAEAPQSGQKPAAPAPQTTPAPQPLAGPRPTTTAEPVNIRYQILIREVGGPQPGTKTVSLTMSMNDSSSIRAVGTVVGRGNFPLNVDVTPTGLRDGKVRTRLSVEYTPLPPESVQGLPFIVRETLNVWLDTGKPMVVSEAADPISDRRLTVEVTATVLR